MIFKIVGQEAWAQACREGVYRGSPDDMRDGFIHFSAPEQLQGTAVKHFRGVADLLLVAFDEKALGAALVWEPSRGGALFPHLYGELATALALWQRPLPLNGEGVPQIPQELVS
ncbi:MAG: DUF952 domain-containing protein [Hyphomicrobium zavarzinii]|uniref:DUF952 domain-containing protein n=1 Tax=Hyphomicrobium zavarzinii TaxID=48292 RepID=UPI001A6442F8|nr:DUF952 domain-containing protein [Hyphomicrobium zavarzinii]MBL8848018.1 DUF952 domain-containing protein [Hyphomicrobium zavarzinii]